MNQPTPHRPIPLPDTEPAVTAAASPPAVLLRGVSKAYGAHPVLRGVDLDIPTGTLTAILGPSGCGKTTLLRLLAGFEPTDTGHIALHGRTVDDGHHRIPPEHRHIGYLPQEGGLFPHLSVAANIGFGLPHGPHRRERIAELLDLVGLPNLGHRYPHQLSGGQQQRIALARALAPAPTLVLLDEPFSALDAGLRATLRADVATVLRRTHTTAVLVTHDQDEALSIADLVAVLHHGCIAQAATPATLYHQPINAWVARFLGATNLIPGHIHGRTAHCPLGELPLLTDTPQLPTDTLLMIRPEQLQLHPSHHHNNSAPTARIEHRAYYGHHTMLTLTLLNPTEYTPEQLRLLARTQTLAPAPGTLVTITVIGPLAALPPDETTARNHLRPPQEAQGLRDDPQTAYRGQG